MSASLVAAAYAMLGIAIPFAILPRIEPAPLLIRYFAIWVLSALLLFFLDDYLVILLFSGLLLVMLAPLGTAERTCFFLVAAPCLPIYLQAYLPFFGINWLILVTHYKVAVFVVLVPLLFRSASDEHLKYGLSTSDVCVLLYALLTTVLVTALSGPTAGPRFLVDQLLMLVVPYFVVSRAFRSTKDLEHCFRALLTVALILAAITLIASLKQWDFYLLKAQGSIFSIPDLRSGFVRIGATTNAHSLGYILAVGLLTLECLKHSLELGYVRLWAFRVAMLVAIFFTDSRGAMLGLAVALVVYAIVLLRSKVLRYGLILAFAAVAVIGSVVLVTGDVSKADAYGTFDYRQKLLIISVEHILENPLLGDLNFLLDRKFDALIQGQGIVDITNLFLQIGLQFGLVGLALFLAIFVPILRDLMRLAERGIDGGSDEREKIRTMSAIVLAAMVGWLALVATTSDVGLTLHVGLVLLAIGRALSVIAGAQRQPAVGAPPANARLGVPTEWYVRRAD